MPHSFVQVNLGVLTYSVLISPEERLDKCGRVGATGLGKDLVGIQFRLGSNSCPPLSLSSDDTSDVSAVAVAVNRIVIRCLGAADGVVAVADKVPSTGDLEAGSEATTQLYCRHKR